MHLYLYLFTSFCPGTHEPSCYLSHADKAHFTSFSVYSVALTYHVYHFIILLLSNLHVPDSVKQSCMYVKDKAWEYML